jgi:hypothetical protein
VFSTIFKYFSVDSIGFSSFSVFLFLFLVNSVILPLRLNQFHFFRFLSSSSIFIFSFESYHSSLQCSTHSPSGMLFIFALSFSSFWRSFIILYANNCLPCMSYSMLLIKFSQDSHCVLLTIVFAMFLF